MSKYIIEIKPEYEDSFKGVMILGAKDSNLFVDPLGVEDLEELNSDYINEHYGSLQDDAYQKGLDDAWEAARKIVCDESFDWNTLLHIFDSRKGNRPVDAGQLGDPAVSSPPAVLVDMVVVHPSSVIDAHDGVIL